MLNANKIRTLIKEKGLSQGDLAHQLGVSDSAMSDWLNNKTKSVKFHHVAKMGEILETPPHELIAIEQINSYQNTTSISKQNHHINDTKTEYKFRKNISVTKLMALISVLKSILKDAEQDNKQFHIETVSKIVELLELEIEGSE